MLQGLQQHLRASHDLFDYGFAEDNPMRLPAVSVEVSAGLYGPNHTFQSPEAASLGDSVSKVQPQCYPLFQGCDWSPCQVFRLQFVPLLADTGGVWQDTGIRCPHEHSVQ